MKKQGKRAAEIVAALLFWGLIWQIAASAADLELILPKPLTVLKRLGELASSDLFYATLGRSFLHIASGYLIGTGLGLGLALAAWKARFFRILLEPLMTIVRATPVASFIIVVILWLPRPGVPAFIAALLVLPVVWENVLMGIDKLDPTLDEVTRVFGIKGWKKWIRTEWPQIRPAFAAAAKTGLGLAWKAGVAAEVIALPKMTIGKMIYDAKLYLETPDLYAWTLAIILVSLVLEALFNFLFRKAGVRHDRA